MKPLDVLLVQPEDNVPSELFEKVWDAQKRSVPDSLRTLFLEQGQMRASDTVKNSIVENACASLNVYATVHFTKEAPKGWSFMAMMATTPEMTQDPDTPNEILRSTFERLPEQYTWYGITENGLLASGFYTPQNDATPVDSAFADLAHCIQTRDPRVRLQMNQELPVTNQASFFASHQDSTLTSTAGTNLGLSFYDLWGDQNRFPAELQIMETFKEPHQENLKRLAEQFEPLLNFPACAPYEIMSGLDLRVGSANWMQGFPKTMLNSFDDLDQVPDPIIRERRRQAIEVYPVVAPYFMVEASVDRTEPYDGVEPEADELQRHAVATAVLGAIDTAQPLITPLCDALETTPRHLRAVRGKSLENMDGVYSGKSTSHFLQSLPLDAIPQSPESWHQLRNTLLGVRDLDRVHRYFISTKSIDNYDTKPDSYALPEEREYTKHAVEAWESSQTRYDAIGKAMETYTPGGMLDMTKHLHKHLFTPLLQHHLYAESASFGDGMDIIPTILGVTEDRACLAGDLTSSLVESWTLRQMIDSTNKWHAHLPGINAALQEQQISGLRLNREWEPILGTLTLSDTLVAEEVTNDTYLSYVGRDQNHCAGGYTESILNNAYDNPDNIAIFALKDPTTGAIQSTLEINFTMDYDENPVRINQHYAKGNTPVDSSLKQHEKTILRAFETAVLENSDNHFTSIERLHDTDLTHPVTYLGKTEEVPVQWLKSGKDPRQKDQLRQTHAVLAPLLPKSLRNFDDLEQKVVAFIEDSRMPKRINRRSVSSELET